MKKLLPFFIIIGLIFTSNYTFSQAIREVSFNSRVNQSQLIVEGKVISKRSFWDVQQHNIYTANKVEVYKVFKGGNISTTVLEVITPGGTVGMHREEVHPSLELNVNDIGIFMLKSNTVNTTSIRAIPLYEPYASVQGFLKYDMVDKRATSVFDLFNNIDVNLYNSITNITSTSYVEVEPFSINTKGKVINKMAPVISGFSPGTVTAGTQTQLTINGSGFGATQGSSTVEFADANDGGAGFVAALTTETVSWSNTQIIVEVTTQAGTGNFRVINGSAGLSPSSLTISYNESNVHFDPGSGTEAYQPRHIDRDGSGGYVWQMFTGFDANTNANASFVRSLETWRCSGTSVNWTIGSTTTTNTIANDNVNVVRFDIGSELPVGVLGRCTSRWSGCGSPINWYVEELDIAFDDGASWEFGPALPSGGDFDFETVSLHELGHGHQLGHVISPGAVMHYAIAPNTNNRVLGANDLAGGNDVHSRSTSPGVCSFSAMTNYSSCGAAPVAEFSGTPTTLCEGNTVAFTDLSTNTPTSWSWTFTGGTPSSSTSQNPTITYNTSGTYQVVLTATNASGSDIETKVGYITVDPLPAAAGTITGSSSECENETGVPYSISAVADATSYVWAVPVGAIVATGQGTTSITVDFGTTSGNVTVTPNNSCGNGGTGIKAVTITNCVTPPTIRPGHCGTIMSQVNQQVYASAVTGATQYEFQLIPHGGGGTLNYVSCCSFRFNFAWFFGWNYNTTYDVSVRAFVGGTWTAYGASCPITSPPIPIVQIRPGYCNSTLSSIHDEIRSTTASNATQYEFRLIPQGGGPQINYVSCCSFRLRFVWFGGWAVSTTYDVSVRSFIDGSWTAYGPDCPVTSPPSLSARFGIFPEDNVEVESIDEIHSNFEMKIYPNPNQGEFVYLNLQGLNGDAGLMVNDIFGKTVLSQQLNGEYGNYNKTLRFNKKLDPGFYLITVVSGNQKITKKLIVQ